MAASVIDSYNARTGDAVKLSIYGSSWDQLPEFAPYYRGVAPVSTLPTIYANARAVLAVTMDEQRDFGMLNNRVFEVLSAGAPMISEVRTGTGARSEARGAAKRGEEQSHGAA